MRKTISLLLLIAMCLSLSACGKSDTCSCDCQKCALCEKKNFSHDATETGDSGDKILFPEPLLLAETQDARVELVGFHQKDYTIKGVTSTRKYIALKICNKADYEIMLDLRNLAVNDEQVNCVYQEPTQNPRVLAGDTTTYYIEIKPVFEDALSSMEDLYQLKGRIIVGKYTTMQGYDGFSSPDKLPFSVLDAMADDST